MLRFQRRFRHPRETVWRAITDPAQLSQWYPFIAVEMDVRVGGTIRFDDGAGGGLDAAITELEPPETFAFREIDDEGMPHLLRFELRAVADGSELVFTHTFEDPDGALDPAVGWHRCLDALRMVVDGEPVDVPEDTARLRTAYAEALRTSVS